MRRLLSTPGSGALRLDWDGRNEAGRLLPSGMYYVRAVVDGAATTSTRVTLVK